jgi:hypothetical protein
MWYNKLMKKTLIYIFIIILIILGSLIFIFNNKKVEIVPEPIEKPIEVLEEKSIVEKYIRNNIKNIASEQPVLGGSWYVTTITIDPSSKTGEVIYEDGHIQGKANFNYSINGEEIKVNLIEEPSPSNKDPVACTMDARQCPDGSYVGRSGPNCEFICPEIKNKQINITEGLKKAYSIYKDGEISECIQDGKTYYTGGINAYDGGGGTFDINGKIVGGCQGFTGKCEGIMPTNCERIYAVYPNIWGFPAINKYNLE